jgi:hypothetical protein
MSERWRIVGFMRFEMQRIPELRHRKLQRQVHFRLLRVLQLQQWLQVLAGRARHLAGARPGASTETTVMRTAAMHSRLCGTAVLAAALFGRVAAGETAKPPGAAPLPAALRFAVEIPEAAKGSLRIEVRKKGATKAAFEAVSESTVPTARPPIVSPSLTLGTYDVSIGRADGSWRCRTTMRPTRPVTMRVFVPWREPVSVSGRVAGSSGLGVPDVPLTVAERDDGSGAPGAWTCHAAPGPLQSGSTGEFRALVDPQKTVLIVAGGWTDPAGIAFVSWTAARTAPLLLSLQQPYRAKARVLDEADGPLSCRVAIEVNDPIERWAAKAMTGGRAESSCASDGRVEAGPFLASAFDLSVTSEEALPAIVHGRVPSDAVWADLGVIHLDRGAALRLSVRDGDRRPVKGASVRAASLTGYILTRTAQSDAGGTAVVSGLPRDDRFDVSVEAAGFKAWSGSGLDPADEIDVELTPAVAVEGTVSDPDGSPVAAKIDALTPEGRMLAGTSATAAGVFSFQNLAAPVVRLRASAEGFGPSEPAVVTLVSGARHDPVRLKLRRLSSIEGRVADSAGSPVPGALVILTRAGLPLAWPPEAGAIATTRTSGDGTFALDVEADGSELVAAMAPGYGTAAVKIGAGAHGPMQFTLHAEARLLARLPSTLSGDATLMVQDATNVTRAFDVAGRREILVDGLVPSSAFVSIRAVAFRQVVLAAGETVTVDLTSGARVHGRVTSRGRAAPRTAVVLLSDPASDDYAADTGAVTASDGTFAFSAIQQGRWRVLASSAEGRAQRFIDVPASGDVEVALELQAHVLRVVVVADDGTPVAGALVDAGPRGKPCDQYVTTGMARDGNGWQVDYSPRGCARATTASDGTAVLSLDTSGPHAVAVKARGFAPWGGVVDVVDGVNEMRADLRRGGPPVVRVTIDSDQPGLAGTLYCIQDGRSSSRAPVAGETTCEGLHAGPAEVAVRVPSFGLARAAVELPESGEVEVALRIITGGTLIVPLEDGTGRSIRVLDDRGAPWNLPYGLGWPPCIANTPEGSERRYVCTELPPGNYTVEIDGTKRARVFLAAGETVVAR